MVFDLYFHDNEKAPTGFRVESNHEAGKSESKPYKSTVYFLGTANEEGEGSYINLGAVLDN